MNQTALRLAAAAFLGIAVSPSHADTVRISNWVGGVYQAVDPTIAGPGRFGVNQFVGTRGPDANPANNDSFFTYCVELTQSFHFNTTYRDYFQQANGSAQGFTLAQASMLSKLYSVATPASVDTLQERVAFQLAVWELMYDTVAPRGVTRSDLSNRGLFYVEAGSDSATQTLANDWVSAAMAYTGPIKYTVAKLHSETAQDFITYSQVPEPGSVALMLAAFGAMGLVSRRRSGQG